LDNVKGLNTNEIAIYKIKEEYHAIDNICPHAGGQLHRGTIEVIDGICAAICPWHGWAFDIKTGKCVDIEDLSLLTLPVKVTDNKILLHAPITEEVDF